MFRFGDFELDLETRQLLRAGQPVPLPPKALELLHLLLDHRPKAIPKAAIRDRLWPGTFVSESNLTSLVSELRSALGDGARQPRFLRTVHGFGYAFCGDAEEVGSRRPSRDREAWYFVVQGGRRIRLEQGENLLGRDPDAAVWIDAASVSRAHAVIRVEDSGATLEDLRSRNGTLLNGSRVEGPMPLHDGDRIEIASEQLVFRAVRRDDLGPTRPRASGGEGLPDQSGLHSPKRPRK